MRNTKHFRQRMSQRGVNQAMVDICLNYGILQEDKHILDRRRALSLLESLQQEQRTLKKIVDKGGVTVVVQGDSLITTYNSAQGRQ